MSATDARPGPGAKRAGKKTGPAPTPAPPCCVPGCPDPLGGVPHHAGVRPRRVDMRPYGYDGFACNRCGQRVIAAWRRERAGEAPPRVAPEPDPAAVERRKAEVRAKSLESYRLDVKGGHRYADRREAGCSDLDPRETARRIVELWDRRDLRGLTAGD